MKDLHIYGAGNLQASRALLLPSWDIIRSNTRVAREAKETRERLRVTERTKQWLSLSRLCRGPHSRVLSRLALLATRNGELTRGLRCWQRNWFPLPNKFWRVLWWLRANRKIISLLAVQSMLMAKKDLAIWVANSRGLFPIYFNQQNFLFCPYFRICGFMIQSNSPSKNTLAVSVQHLRHRNDQHKLSLNNINI